jgi:opacity protein-like surface antigen
MNRMQMLLGGVGLGLAAFAGAAGAQQLTWYAGADLVRLETEVDDKTGVPPIITGTASTPSLRLKGGAHVLPWLDIELQLILARDETFSTEGTTNKVQTGVAGIFAKPHHQVGPVDLYALVGFSSSSHEFSGVIAGSKSVSDISYGIGAQYKFTPKLALSIDWTQYTKKNLEIAGLSGGLDVTVKALGVGLNYTF